METLYTTDPPPLTPSETTLQTKRKGKEKRNRKDSAGSDDTASMIKGGGYLGARTRQPPTAQTHEKKLMWVRGVGCRSIWTQSMTVVACVHTNLWLLTPGFKMRNDC